MRNHSETGRHGGRRRRGGGGGRSVKGVERKGSEGGDWEWKWRIGEEKKGIEWEFGDEQCSHRKWKGWGGRGYL